MSGRSQLLRAVVLTLLAALLLLPAAAASAQVEPWIITSYDVDLMVEANADVLVTERIQLDFQGLERHGIFRTIPLWDPLPDTLPADLDLDLPEGADPGDYQRELTLRDLVVTSPSGAPTNLEVEGPSSALNGNVRIRIGDPNVTITGRQEYVIQYRVVGAMNAFDDHDELFWDAIGDQWPVPIQAVTVTVTGPQAQRVACYEGPTFSIHPCPASIDGGVARFSNTNLLPPYEGLSVVVAYDPADVDVPAATIRRRPGPVRFLLGNGAAVPLTAVVALLGIGGVVLLAWREGRDRVARGSVMARGIVDRTQASERRRGAFEPRPVPVEFRPPEDLPPGLLGLIIDESVDSVDISATLVDLAVRGHLRIEELQTGGWFRRGDWNLVQGEAPQDEPNAYEALLLKGLFSGRSSVSVSDLKGTFAATYRHVENALYSAGQGRGWFARRPDHARAMWAGIGISVAVVGVITLIALGNLVEMGLVGIPVIVAGILLAILSPRMPRRTPAGSALVTRTLGFREFIARAETERMEFAEAENLFVKYLPYAVVFGVVDKWSQAFEAIGIDPGAAVGGFYVGHGPWNFMAFSAGMNEFSEAVGPALATAPPSSSGGSGFSGGGFSGGGGGGGGGGSW